VVSGPDITLIFPETIEPFLIVSNTCWKATYFTAFNRNLHYFFKEKIANRHSLTKTKIGSNCRYFTPGEVGNSPFMLQKIKRFVFIVG
jgi:hypothetical protein